MKIKENYPRYALAGLAAVVLALWAGMPVAFLFLLFCPAMMYFMVRGMGGSHRKGDDADVPDHLKRPGASTLDGSHERIE
jgi:hypothetical protein